MTGSRGLGPLLAAATLGLAPVVTPAGAQGLSVSAGASAQTARFVRSVEPDLERTGLVLQVHGGVAFGRIGLEGGYRQGRLSTDVAGAEAEDLVEGEVLLVLRARPWLAFHAGPRFRALISDAGTERWTRIEVRASAGGDLVPGRLRAEAEFWRTLGAEVNVTGGADAASGAQVGLGLAIPNSPVGLRFFYALDRAILATGRDELLEGVGLGITLGRR